MDGRGWGRGGEGGGGDRADIKSNNPHLTGGGKVNINFFWACVCFGLLPSIVTSIPKHD